MSKTFINLPASIATAISQLLSEKHSNMWLKNAEILHNRYMKRLSKNESYLQSADDSTAYLALRTAATYAQINSALLQIKEVLPDFHPNTLLDLGSGPGVAVWAAREVWPSVVKATCIDNNQSILSLGEIIRNKSDFPVAITWENQDIRSSATKELPTSDLIIIANVLNEMSHNDREKILEIFKKNDTSVIVILEPGNTNGVNLVQRIAEDMQSTHILIAPYVQNTFILSKEYWIHFSQRFIRPSFERQVRQFMREQTKMASDWEETKYTYLAFSKRYHPQHIWGRCIGPVKKLKGYLQLPILTDKDITFTKVLKRHKKEYMFAKSLSWGDSIMSKEEIIHDINL